jgi:hypothetical protein
MTLRISSAGAFAAALCIAAAAIPSPALAQGQPIIVMGPCTEEGYRPVCARSRRGILVTYANACMARSARARVINEGACVAACPAIFQPVCAVDASGKRKTYANDCAAKAAGAKVVRRGRCIPLVR